jgi:MFS family permease
LIGATFPAGPPRSRALAVWGAVGASGLAAGAILGGLLTAASWRLTFLVNVPLALLCALGAVFAVAPDAGSGPRAGRVPLLASVLGTGSVLTTVLGLTLGSGRGWRSGWTLACLAAAVVLLVGFVRNERVSPSALIEPVLRHVRSLSIGAAATALYMASVGSEFYLLTLLLQSMKGYPPLRAGLAFLPLAVMVTAGNPVAGRALRRFIPAGVLMSGFAIAAAGLALLSVTQQGDSYAVDLLPGLLLSGFGHGLIFTSMFVIGTRDVPASHQSTAGALLTTSQYLVGAVTVAVLTLVLGPAPDDGSFRAAFLVTAGAAAAGAALIAAARRRLADVAG